MSLLRININNATAFEFQKDIYNNLDATILDVEGDYIPAIEEKTDYTIVGGDHYLQLLDRANLENETILVLNSTIMSGYSLTKENGRIYANKYSQTLTDGIYRIGFYLNTGSEYVLHYSELFRKIS